MNEEKDQTLKPIIYKKMHVYKLLRDEKKDKKGRPALFWKRFGAESLVWAMTTKRNKTREIPVKMNLDNSKKITYFYLNGLEKIKTKDLIENWKYFDDSGQIIETVIPSKIQKQLINKISNYTNEKKPYETINHLNKIKEKLNEKNKILKINQSQLKNETKMAKANHKILKQKNIELKNENESIKTNNETLKQENIKLKNEKNTKNQKINFQETIINNLNETINSLTINQEQLKNENESIKTNNETLKQENIKLKNEKNTKNQKINFQERKINQKAMIIKNQTGQVNNLKKSLISKTNELNMLKDKYTILKNENKLIKSQMEIEKLSDYEQEM